MPVDYKIRSLRRLFGEGNFLRPVQTESPSIPRPSYSKSADLASSFSSENDAQQTNLDSTRSRRSKAPGGVPRYIFSEQPPRAVRSKAAGGQLFSVYLIEKQKMKLYYGALRDGQFKRYVEKAKARRYNTDAELLRLLEMRLDTFLYRTGFVKTPRQGRQWIFQGKVTVNGKRCTTKSSRLRPGDVLTFRDDHIPHVLNASREAAENREKLGCGASWILGDAHPAGMLPWMEIDRRGLSAALVREPNDEEVRALANAVFFPYIRAANLNPHAAMRAYR